MIYDRAYIMEGHLDFNEFALCSFGKLGTLKWNITNLSYKIVVAKHQIYFMQFTTNCNLIVNSLKLNAN